MAYSPAKLCRKHAKSMKRPGAGKEVKRETNRVMRRDAKRDPEAAHPKRPTKGYSD